MNDQRRRRERILYVAGRIFQLAYVAGPLSVFQHLHGLRTHVFHGPRVPGGHTFTCAAVKKAGKRYKYYVSTQAVKKSYDDCPIKTLSAPLLEGVIIEQMRRILTRPEWSKSVIGKVKELLNDNSPDDTKIVQTLQNFDLLWDELFPLEQQRLAKLIIQKVVVYSEKVIITLRPLGMAGLLHEMMPDAKIKKGLPTENTPLEITIPIKFKKHGGRKYITTPTDVICQLPADQNTKII